MVSKSRSRTVIRAACRDHARPFPLQAVRSLLPGRRHALRARAGQAGGDITFGLESNVPSRKDSGLFARAIHRGFAERAWNRDMPLPEKGRAQGSGRLHRRTAGREDRSF